MPDGPEPIEEFSARIVADTSEFVAQVDAAIKHAQRSVAEAFSSGDALKGAKAMETSYREAFRGIVDEAVKQGKSLDKLESMIVTNFGNLHIRAIQGIRQAIDDARTAMKQVEQSTEQAKRLSALSSRATLGSLTRKCSVWRSYATCHFLLGVRCRQPKLVGAALKLSNGSEPTFVKRQV